MGPNRLIEVVFFFCFIVSKTSVFLRCLSSTPKTGGFFGNKTTHTPPLGNQFQAAQEMAELNLLDASRRSLLGTPNIFGKL